MSKIRVGTVVRLKNSEDYRNTYAVVNEVNEDYECSVVIYDNKGRIQNEMSWLVEDEDFIVYKGQGLPVNPPENFIFIGDYEDSAISWYAEDYGEVTYDMYREYFEDCIRSNEFLPEYIEELRQNLIKCGIIMA